MIGGKSHVLTTCMHIQGFLVSKLDMPCPIALFANQFKSYSIKKETCLSSKTTICFFILNSFKKQNHEIASNSLQTHC